MPTPTPPRIEGLTDVTRVEVIDEDARVLSLQGASTLKVGLRSNRG